MNDSMPFAVGSAGAWVFFALAGLFVVVVGFEAGSSPESTTYDVTAATSTTRSAIPRSRTFREGRRPRGPGPAGGGAGTTGGGAEAGGAGAAATVSSVWVACSLAGTGCDGSPRKSRTCSIVQRRAGSCTMVPSSSGVIQPASSSRGGSSLTMRYSAPSTWSPTSYGGRPASTWKAVAPSDQTSAASSPRPPVATSGARYAGDPVTMPVCVSAGS